MQELQSTPKARNQENPNKEEDLLAHLKNAVEEDEEQEEFLNVGAGIDFSDPNGPLSRFYLNNSQLAAVIILGIIFVFLNFVPLRQTDVWGHLKFGEWIVQNRSFPEGNPFNPFMRQEVPSNYYSWLSQAGFYLIYDLGASIAGGDAINQMAGGVNMLRFTHAFLVLARLIFLLLAFTRLTGSFRLGMVGMLLTVLINLGGHLVIFRPQVVGELCFAMLLFALSRPQLTKGSLVSISLLMVLWANLHGSYVIGLAVLGAFLLGRAIEFGWQHKTWKPKQYWLDHQVRYLALALGFSIVAVGLLNPVGPWIYYQTITMAMHPVVRLMDEWRPLFSSTIASGHYSYIITIVLLIGSLVYAKGRITPTAVILVLIFGLQPLQQQRAMLWWFTILPWIILPMWIHGSCESIPQWATCSSQSSFRKTLVAVAVMFVCVLWSIPGIWALDREPAPVDRSVSEGTAWQLAFQLRGEGNKEKPWSPKLDQWLKKYYPNGQYRGGIFTSETSGDFLVWALPKEMPVFTYAHVHLVTPEHWQLVAAVRGGTDDWEKVLNYFRINMIVVEPELNKKLRDLISKDEDWEIIYDEFGNSKIHDYRCRLMLAVRRVPVREKK